MSQNLQERLKAVQSRLRKEEIDFLPLLTTDEALAGFLAIVENRPRVGRPSTRVSVAPLTEEQKQEILLQKLESISDVPSPLMTERYVPLQTSRVISLMRDAGWSVRDVVMRDLRENTKQNEILQKLGGNPEKYYGAHVLRFRQKETKLQVGDSFVELVFKNSMNGSMLANFDSGVFKLACKNGATVRLSRSVSFGGRHTVGGIVSSDNFIEKMSEAVSVLPQIVDKIHELRGIRLPDSFQKEFARQAALLRWDDPARAAVDSELLLQPRRTEDRKEDSWTVFNVVQENLLRGGFSSAFVKNAKSGEGRKISDISESLDSVEMNSNLWETFHGMLLDSNLLPV